LQKYIFLDTPLPGFPTEYGMPETLTREQTDAMLPPADQITNANLAVIRSGRVHPINRAASTHGWNRYAALAAARKQKIAA
jgi:hypothetical protein